MSHKYVVNTAKGFSKPKLFFLNDLTKKIQAGTLHQGKYIASQWLQSLSEQQFKNLSCQMEKRVASADLVATVMHLVCCEQENAPTEFTEEDLELYVHHFHLLASLVGLVKKGLVEVNHFCPISKSEKIKVRAIERGVTGEMMSI